MSESRRPLVVLAAFVAGVLLVAAWGAGSSGAAAPQKKMTIYLVVTAVKIDPRTRPSLGCRHCPYWPKTQNAPEPPFPGDSALFSFDLFAHASLAKKTGKASAICHYFSKHVRCTASFELPGGTVLAAGSTDFNRTAAKLEKRRTFMLTITGGTAKYIGANGQLAITPVPASKKQRLQFTLLG